MNKSVMKCCICNNENIGQFATINNKKYHLCCIEQLQQENKKLNGTIQTYDILLKANVEENKRIKENYDRIYNENCKLREEHNINDISLLDENYRLKKGIDKAIEYIEWNKDKAKFDNNTKEYDNYTFLNEENINDLLDILNEVLE